MTKAGVEYNLSLSPFEHNIIYEDGNNLTFYFSSEVCKERFCEKVIENREELENSLSHRFKMRFCLHPMFCDVQLYKREERRGFRIIMNGSEVLWPGKLKYNGTTLLEENCDER